MGKPLSDAQYLRTRRLTLRQGLLLVLLVSLTAATLGGVRAAHGASFPFVESFRNTTAPDFALGGSAGSPATLTAGGIDPAGDGWLRLTSASNDRFGYAYNTTAFPSGEGIVYDFDYATWGPQTNGADGLAFVLFDGATTDAQFHPGPAGGALGYTKCNDGVTQMPGLSNAYMAVGFDEYGNFANSGICQQTGAGNGEVRNRISVRGGVPDYQHLRSVIAGQGVAGTRANARHVTVTVLPENGTTTVSAQIRYPDGTVQPIATNLPLATPPATLKFGFTGSTGGLYNNHEIRDLRVAKPTDLQVEVEPEQTPLERDTTQAYVARVTNTGPNPTTGVAVTASAPDTTDVTWTCTATGGAACPAASGAGVPDGDVDPLPVGGTLAYRITGMLTTGADDSSLRFSAEPTGDTSEMTPADNTAEGRIDVTPEIDAPPTYLLSAGGVATATGASARGGHLTRSWQWYRCAADGSDCRAIDGSTASSYQTTTAERDGNLRVRETFSNRAGSVFADSVAWTLPDTTLLGAPPPTTRPPSTFSFSSFTAGATFECRLDDAVAWSACIATSSFPALADGPHRLEVRAVFGGLADPTPVTHEWTVAATTSVSIVAPVAGLTANPSPTVTMAGAAGASWTLRRDDVEVDHGTFDDDGRATSTPLDTLDDGSHVLRVDVEDAVGNVAHDSVTLTVDTQAPAAPTITAGPPPATFANDAEISFDAPPDSQPECRLDGGAWGPCTSPWEIASLADGPHLAEIRAVDDAGNAGAIARHAWTVDRATDGQILAPAPGITPNPQPTVTLAGEPGATGTVSVDGTPLATGVLDANGIGVIPLPQPLSDGEHQIAVRFVDTVANLHDESVRIVVETPVPPAIPDPPAAPTLLPGPITTAPTPNHPLVAHTQVATRTTVDAADDTVRVGCALDQGALERCVVRIYTRTTDGERDELLGSDTARFESEDRSGTVDVGLNALGRRTVAEALGGQPVIVASVATSRSGRALRAKDVRATLFPQRLELTVPTVLPFSIDRGLVTGAARRAIADLAPLLRYATAVRCVGFTDNRGSTAANRTLGLRRAQALCRTLRRLGVRAKLTWSSHGEEQPRATNATAGGRAKNRRVELEIRY